MTSPQILATEFANDFRTKPVRINSDGSVAEIKTVEPEMSFLEMSNLRIAVQPQAIYDELREAGGHRFANLGVSATITLNWDGNDYLALVHQFRGDFGAIVATKLLSGYLHSDNLVDPTAGIEHEIAEELLIFGRDKKLMRFRKKPPIQ